MSVDPFTTALVKATGAAVTKLIGGHLRARARDVKRQRSVKGALRAGPATIDQLPMVLSDEQTEALLDLLGSAEIENFCLRLSASIYLGHWRAQTLGESYLQQQLRTLINERTQIEGQGLANATSVLYAQMRQSISAINQNMLGGLENLPQETQRTLIKSAAALAAETLRAAETVSDLRTRTLHKQFEDQLRQQIANVHATMRLPHVGDTKSVPYDRLFVQPRISLGADTKPLNSLGALLREHLRAVVLGDPGGGKSTSLCKFAFDVCSGKEAQTRYRVPLIVSLKDYADRYHAERVSLMEYIECVCETPYAVSPPTGALDRLLSRGVAIVLFDGLDELLDTSLRRTIVAAVEGFSFRYPTTPVLVTSRRVGYNEAPLDEDLFPVVSLEEFEAEQVENYARKWFGLDESVAQDKRTSMAESFLRESVYVRDLRRNPLMLSLMCGLYSGRVMRNPWRRRTSQLFHEVSEK